MIDGVKMYDPELTTCLSPDYSDTGVGWILQQKICNCPVVSPLCCESGWRLVLAGGKFNSAAESRYSPTEGEAHAMVTGLEDSKYYTLGCPSLYVATDHKPLLGIFNDRALDTIKNPRLVRLKQRTLWWRFSLIYVPGCRQAAADMMSRRRRKLPASLHMLQVNESQELTMDDDMMEQFVVRLNSIQVDINTVELNSLDIKVQVITWEQVLQATDSDTQIQKLVEQIQRGFPDSQYELPADIKEFQKFRHGLSVVDGVVCYKHRIVVPQTLRSMVLDT